MLRTNLTVLLIVIGTLSVYTAVANMIPQVASEVPEETTIGADVTPQELAAIGEELYAGAGGCTACHGLGTRAPDLVGVSGTTCATRRAGLACKEYLYESLTEPGVFVIDGFQPIMPDMRRILSEAQIWALVAFLQNQGGEITVTTADIPPESAGGAGAAAGGTRGTGPGFDTTGPGFDATVTDPVEILRASTCLACHQLGEEGVALGPRLDEMAGRLDPEYIRRSILLPNADTAGGFEAVAGTMPMNFGDQLSAGQLETIVRFLAGQR
jgi:mono/diheme cytochrome c family protein